MLEVMLIVVINYLIVVMIINFLSCLGYILEFVDD